MGSFSGPVEWGRLLTAMITPFHADGSLDEDGVGRVAAHLVDKEANDGIVVNGTTGESPTLSHAEKLRVLRLTLDAVGDRAAVIFGAGTNATAESVELAREGERTGAHGIMLVNPYYSRPGQAGLEAHFRAAAAATGLPVMLYNIQPRSAINLETDTLLRLAEVPNIVAVKEASGNLGQISDVCRSAPAGFRVYSGDDALTLPMLSLGAHGLVSVVAHVAGRELAEMLRAFPGDPSRARAVHHRLAPTFKTMFAWPSPTPIKFAASLLGLCSETVRLPLTPLEPEARAAVAAILDDLGRRAAGAAVVEKATPAPSASV